MTRLEITEPGQAPRLIDVEGVLEVGREEGGVRLHDPEVSRRHLVIALAGPDTLSITDLGSTNGTFVNDRRLTGSVEVRSGDVVRIGNTQLRVTATEAPSDATVVGDATVAGEPAARRPAHDNLERLELPEGILRYRAGSVGERMARSYGAAVRRARRVLAGLGSEPWGAMPEICLVDPFASSGDPETVHTQGTVVEAQQGRIWVVVSAEAPPEPPGRALALFFGASLPAAAEVGRLLEGYGLAADDAPDPDPLIRDRQLPALAAAEGELGVLMAYSFVRFLIRRDGRETFLRLISTAQAGTLSARAEELYGASLAALEEGWRLALSADAHQLRLGAFIRTAAGYLRPHLRRELEIFAYMVLSLAFTMTFPFATRALFDDAIPRGDLGSVAQLLGILGGAFALSLLAGLRRSYLTAYVSGSVIRQLRREMFGRLQALSPGWFASRNQGDVLSRFFSDVAQVEGALSSILREGIFQLLSLVVASVVLLVLNPLLGAVVLVGAPLVALTYRAMAKGAARRSTEVQERQGTLFAVAAENYAAQSVVKALGLERREVDRFERASERLFASGIRLQVFGGLFGLSVNLIVTALRLFIVGLGAWMIIQGQLTIGALVAFLGLMGEVLAPAAQLTTLGQQLQAVSGSFARVNEILAETSDVAEPDDPQPLAPLSGEIRLAGVSLTYPNGREVLHGIDCAIRAGSRTAFVGPSGGGKSSILALLMRFYDPSAGSVLVDGRDIRTAGLASLRGQIGIVLQDTFLFDTSIRENVRLGRPAASDAEVEAAIQAARLADAVAALEGGLDARVGEGGGRLSGGQRQRVAIARAILRDPRILLLDEATSALDPITERQIAATLEELRDGRTIVAVTHRLSSIVDFDEIFVLVDGRIVEEGRHADLIERGGTYAELWREQSGGFVPAEAAFDPIPALGRIPLFARLGADELRMVADRLRSLTLQAGDAVAEQEGQLLFLARGRANVRRPNATGEMVVTAELRSGDAFGVGALFGSSGDAMMQAVTGLQLLALDGAATMDLARSVPAIAAALRGTAGPSTDGARVLGRVTLGLPAWTGGSQPSVHVEAPSPEDIRRATGTLPTVGS